MSRAPETLGRAEGWRAQAACLNADPDLFYPVGQGPDALNGQAKAKAICAGCPIQPICLQYALDTPEEHGIWGGLDETERRSLRRRAGRHGGSRRLSPCGTLAAYKRHRRRDEDPCPACREANRLAQQDKPPAQKGRPIPECGTNSAYGRHSRLREPIDEACRAAHREADYRLRTTGTSKAAA